MSKVYVKFCGLSRFSDIGYANLTMPHYIGYVFAESKRKVAYSDTLLLSEQLLPEIKRVGVFVNVPVDKIVPYASEIDVFQLHGFESDDYIQKLKKILPHKEIWKAFRVKNEEDVAIAVKSSADMIMLDSFNENLFGGSGKTIDIDLLKSCSELLETRPYFLAGGLNISNIMDAVTELNPYGIDISSGIETDGLKDLNKMKEIISLLKENDCYAN